MADCSGVAGRAASGAVRQVAPAHIAATDEGLARLHGPDREVYSRSIHRDVRRRWTSRTGELGVTIGGEPFDHLLFQFILSHSGWRYARVCFSETFSALVSGLQGRCGSWALFPRLSGATTCRLRRTICARARVAPSTRATGPYWTTTD